MYLRRSCVLVAAVTVMLLIAPAAGYGITGRIYENKGIRAARLGMKDSTAAAKIGGKRTRVTDSSYDYTVWLYRFGAKKSGKFPVEMYSKGKHSVFEFVINCTTLKTKNGSRVGTSEGTLASRYGSTLKKSVGPVYTDYWMGTRSGRTDFYVKAGKVKQIVISRY